MPAPTLDRTAADELTYVSFPIEKFEANDDGDLVVYGKATDGSVDSDEQIVDPQWSEKAISEWLQTGANVRVMHSPGLYPAGKGLGVDITPDGHYVRALIVEPNAKRLVEKGVLQAYSVGISRPVIVRDVTGKARGGIIKGGRFAEISLVDRPANRNCAFTLVKADKTGAAEWVGELDGDAGAGFLAKAASPADVARRIQGRRSEAGEVAHSYSDPVAQRLADALAAERAPEFAGKRDFTAGERQDAAASGDAMDDGSFPIRNKGDLRNAIRLAGHAKDPDAARAHIKRRAADLHAEDMIPETWKVELVADLVKLMSAEEITAMVGFDLVAKGDGEASEDTSDDDDESGMPDNTSTKSSKPSAQTAADAEEANDSDGDAPADAVKAGKGKGKKKMPFGGDKAPAFGSKPDGEDAPDETKAAALRGQIAELQAELAKCVPTTGVTGTPAAEELPAARGGASLTSLAGNAIQPDQLWGKARNRETDAPYAVQRVHDAMCAAYSPALVKAAYPALASPGEACDAAALKEAALAAVASGDLDAGETLLAVAKAAEYLTSADAMAVTDAMAGLHKSFTDMYPSVRLSPGQVMPQKFQRPYITDGHARMPAPSGDTSPGPVTSYHPQAADFRRGPLTAGQEAPSPGNKGDSNPYPAGTPVSAIYAHSAAAQRASAALRTIHDHYAAAWNGVCPMGANAGPVTPSGLLPVGKAKKKGRKGKNLPSEMAPMDPVPAMPAEPAQMKTVSDPVVSTGTDITIMLAGVERQIRKLRREQEAQIAELTKGFQTRLDAMDTENEGLRRSIDILGAQGDTTTAPNRGVVAKAAAATTAAERRSLVDEAGERHRAEYLTYLESLAGSGDPAMAEGARAQIRKVLTP